MKLIVVPEAHREAAEAAVRAALIEDGRASERFAVTVIRLPGKREWTVHASSAAGKDDRLGGLIQRKLREAGL